MRAGELAQWLGAALEGNGETELSSAAPLESARPDQLSFAADLKSALRAQSSEAGCLIVPLEYLNQPVRTVIRSPSPRSAFARAVTRLHPRAVVPGVHPSAVIGTETRIGAGSSIGPGCVIGARVTLGENCLLHANVTLYDDVDLGREVILHSGCVIGADGFGFALEDGHYVKFPQIGRVIIEDFVEIGANSCVDRAALGVTRIGEGTKLDNMVHVAHNCNIGRHVVIAAQTGMAGGVIIDDYAIIGGQVGLGEKAHVESGAVLASKCGVLNHKVVPRNQVVWGIPARPLKEYLRQLAYLHKMSRERG